MKKHFKLLVMVLMLVLTAAAAGCGDKGQAADNSDGVSGSLTAAGSTALQPLVEQAAKQYMTKNIKAQITVQGGGSGTGLTQVTQGGADIGNSDIFAEEKSGIDATQLVDTRVCVVGMAAVVNPGVTIDNLTKAQLIDIFTGKTTNWKEVGGSDQKIVIINRAKGSGTRATFKSFALDGKEEAKGMEEDSSGLVRKIVKETPGAISYLALSYLDGSVKPIKLDGKDPNKENITSGAYPVWAYEHMYTKGQPEGLKKAFLDYMLTPEVQGDMVVKLGYIPVTEMKIERDAKGNVTTK
ncbi:MAG TPA: phosphate-binding protein [Desulfotomaculum sp.]|nr:phosphate-binding protein [Desulfotomaculum sp.]